MLAGVNELKDKKKASKPVGEVHSAHRQAHRSHPCVGHCRLPDSRLRLHHSTYLDVPEPDPSLPSRIHRFHAGSAAAPPARRRRDGRHHRIWALASMRTAGRRPLPPPSAAARRVHNRPACHRDHPTRALQTLDLPELEGEGGLIAGRR